MAIEWTEEQVFNIAFSDEIWAMGRVHTTSFVTVKSNGSDRYDPENLQYKYNKLLGWMFHGVIFQGWKGPAVFWEKN
jgi:hypothetical protein